MKEFIKCVDNVVESANCLIEGLEEALKDRDKEIDGLKVHIAKLEERVKLMDHFFVMVGKHRLKLERTLIQHDIPLPAYFVKEDPTSL